MAQSTEDLGLGLLLLPIGFLLILLAVGAMFLMVHESPATSTLNQPAAQQQSFVA